MGPKSSQKASYFKNVCGLKHRNFFVDPNLGMYWPMHTLSITSFKNGRDSDRDDFILVGIMNLIHDLPNVLYFAGFVPCNAF